MKPFVNCQAPHGLPRGIVGRLGGHHPLPPLLRLDRCEAVTPVTVSVPRTDIF